MPFVAYRAFSGIRFERGLAAAEDGVAPPVILEATHIRALQVTTLADLEYHGLRVKELPGA